MGRDNGAVPVLSGNRFTLFVVAVVLALLMVSKPLYLLLHTTENREYYSHIILIPVITAYLLYRNRLPGTNGRNFDMQGLPVMAAGLLIYLAGWIWGMELSHADRASWMTLSGVILIIGAFLLLFGVKSFRNALFPLMFLLFMVPIPSFLMELTISLLQAGSAELCDVLFSASGITYLREGFTFHLPSFSIEVARQCSGIRSSIALLITAALIGHLFLSNGYQKSLLVACVIPIAILKNSIRILVLTLLGVHVDIAFLTDSSLHSDGGVLFFLLGFLLLVPVVLLLKQFDNLGSIVR